jgi:hypothetical protein
MYSARVLALVQRITRRWCSAPVVRDFVRTHLQPATIDDDVGTLLLKFVIGVAYTLAVSTARVPRAVGLWIPAATLQLFVSDKQLFAVHDEAAAAAPQCLMPYVAAVLYAYGTTSSFAALVAPLLALEHTPVEQALAQYRQVLREMPDVSAAERAVRTRLQREPVASLWRCGAASASPEDMYTYMFANAFLRPAAAADRAYTAAAGQDSVVQLVSAYTAADSLEAKRNIFAAIVAQSIQLVLQGPVARSVAAPNEFLELVRVYAGGRTDQDRAAAFLKLVAAAISETGPHAHVGSVADAVETYAKEQTPGTFAGIVASAVVQLSSQQAATDRVRVVLQAVANSGTAGSAAGVATSLLALLPPPGAATAASFGTGERDAKTGASPQVVAEGLYSGGGVGGSFAHDLSEVFSDVDKATLQQLETAVESSPALVADSTRLSKAASPSTAPPKPAEIARTPTVPAARIAAPTASTTVEQFKDVESLNVTNFASQEERDATIRILESEKARSDMMTQVKIAGLLKQARAARVDGVAAVAASDRVGKPTAKSKETPETKLKQLLQDSASLEEITAALKDVSITPGLIEDIDTLIEKRSDKREIARELTIAMNKAKTLTRNELIKIGQALVKYNEDVSKKFLIILDKLVEDIKSNGTSSDKAGNLIQRTLQNRENTSLLSKFDPSEEEKPKCASKLEEMKTYFDSRIRFSAYNNFLEEFQESKDFMTFIQTLQEKCNCEVFPEKWFRPKPSKQELQQQEAEKKQKEAEIKQKEQEEKERKLDGLKTKGYQIYIKALIDDMESLHLTVAPTSVLRLTDRYTDRIKAIDKAELPVDASEKHKAFDELQGYVLTKMMKKDGWRYVVTRALKALFEVPEAKKSSKVPVPSKPGQSVMKEVEEAAGETRDRRTLDEKIRDAIVNANSPSKALEQLQIIKDGNKGYKGRMTQKVYDELVTSVKKMISGETDNANILELLDTMTFRIPLGAVSRKHISGLARAFDAARGAGHASHRRFNAAFAKELTRELGAATARRLLAELARLGKSRTGKTPRGLMLDK